MLARYGSLLYYRFTTYGKICVGTDEKEPDTTQISMFNVTFYSLTTYYYPPCH